jgi:hypothetical protein
MSPRAGELFWEWGLFGLFCWKIYEFLSDIVKRAQLENFKIQVMLHHVLFALKTKPHKQLEHNL